MASCESVTVALCLILLMFCWLFWIQFLIKMRRHHVIVALFVCGYSAAIAQSKVPVFVSGEEGHRSYRIPAIVVAPNGDLIAIAEGRVKHAADFGDINIVMKRSSDDGKTWSSLMTLV